MDILTISLIAIGLSFDTFAVSLSCGVTQSKILFRQAIKLALIMGLFQGGFPVLGFYLGSTASAYVGLIDHWLAFGLLAMLGLRMIINGSGRKRERKPVDITRMSVILTLAIGTSIDAFAVGISLGFLHVKIWYVALNIGIITFIAAMIAVRIGKSAAKRQGKTVEVVGGLILLGIGIKILLEHTLFS
jgi:putative Mn2+ efflux pump MntP